jgi:hypothetical protein
MDLSRFDSWFFTQETAAASLGSNVKAERNLVPSARSRITGNENGEDIRI